MYIHTVSAGLPECVVNTVNMYARVYKHIYIYVYILYRQVHDGCEKRSQSSWLTSPRQAVYEGLRGSRLHCLGLAVISGGSSFEGLQG